MRDNAAKRAQCHAAAWWHLGAMGISVPVVYRWLVFWLVFYGSPVGEFKMISSIFNHTGDVFELTSIWRGQQTASESMIMKNDDRGKIVVVVDDSKCDSQFFARSRQTKPLLMMTNTLIHKRTRGPDRDSYGERGYWHRCHETWVCTAFNGTPFVNIAP